MMPQLNSLLDAIPFDPADWPGSLALVGGSVRDALLNRTRVPLDLDFVCPGPVAERARLLARRLGAGFAVLDAEREIVRLVLDSGITLDFARQQGADLVSDLARRDYTVNAIAWDVRAGELSDPFDGRGDLTRRTLRAIAEANLVDDPLRLLRGYRLAAQLDFAIEPGTRAWIGLHAHRLAAVSAERVREELCALICAPTGADALLAAYRDGLLADWLPEIAPMEAIGPSGYHHLPLIEHTFEVIRQVDGAMADFAEQVRADMDRQVTGGHSVRTLVKLGALLHDIAKPPTSKLDPASGRMSFIGHESLGANMTRQILQRLKFSRDEERWVAALVQHHLRPGQLAAHWPPSNRAVYRLCRDLGQMLPALLMLALADRRSTLGPQVGKDDLVRAVELTGRLLGHYHTPGDPLAHPRILIDGNGLMAELDLKPGPRVGQLLAAIQEAQATGEVTGREEALALARTLL
ncbi:HD domain-containing protein [Gloeobacter morelensis]|uniref:HD domain-containing protein n=1 Tax=Gloeobacter morelensis MG652769 TaxID=2781736 RepID=A0ABY3PKG4_9CYAN|nr:HD domain-containing protein [Gloeobacter morelensis]UFP94114.1 HD domain-containing protein [Gloeobacter morelensis MG652769]